MSKTSAIAKKYQCLYPDQNVTFKGAWITIEGKAYRSKEIKQMIDKWNYENEFKKEEEVAVEMNEFEVDDEVVEEVVELKEVVEPEPEAIELLRSIYEKASKARHSSKISEMRKDVHDIVKLAKRLLNLKEFE